MDIQWLQDDVTVRVSDSIGSFLWFGPDPAGHEDVLWVKALCMGFVHAHIVIRPELRMSIKKMQKNQEKVSEKWKKFRKLFYLMGMSLGSSP